MAYGLLFHRVGVTYHGNGGDKSVIIDKILNHIPHYTTTTTQNALDGTSSHVPSNVVIMQQRHKEYTGIHCEY